MGWFLPLLFEAGMDREMRDGRTKTIIFSGTGREVRPPSRE